MIATVPTREIGTDQVILLGSVTLVSSRSERGSWRIVRDGQCSCPGFHWRRHCRHIEAARIAREQETEKE